MSTGQRGTKHGREMLGWWQRMRWRWKLTIAGFAMGSLACGLWAAPAAVLAFKGRYTTHGWIYAVTVKANFPTSRHCRSSSRPPGASWAVGPGPRPPERIPRRR